MDEMMRSDSQNNFDACRPLLAKWLKILFILQVTSAVFSLSSLFALSWLLSTVAQVISVALSLVLMYVLLKLSAANGYYRKSFYAMIFQVSGSVATFLLTGLDTSVLSTALVSLVSLVVSVSALVATYQQYQGHRWITWGAGDRKFSGQWNSLFYWQLVVGLVMGVVSAGVTTIGVVSGLGTEGLMNMVAGLVGVPSAVLQVIYLWFLYKTWKLFPEAE